MTTIINALLKTHQIEAFRKIGLDITIAKEEIIKKMEEAFFEEQRQRVFKNFFDFHLMVSKTGIYKSSSNTNGLQIIFSLIEYSIEDEESAIDICHTLLDSVRIDLEKSFVQLAHNDEDKNCYVVNWTSPC